VVLLITAGQSILLTQTYDRFLRIINTRSVQSLWFNIKREEKVRGSLLYEVRHDVMEGAVVYWFDRGERGKMNLVLFMASQDQAGIRRGRGCWKIVGQGPECYSTWPRQNMKYVLGVTRT